MSSLVSRYGARRSVVRIAIGSTVQVRRFISYACGTAFEPLKKHSRDFDDVTRNGTGQRRYASFKPSYVHRTGNVPLSGHNLGYYVDRMDKEFGDREGAVDLAQGIRKNFTQYKQDIHQLSKGLLSLGLEIGDRLAIWSPNRYEWLVTQFAAAKLGLILLTLNPAFQTSEMEFCLKKTKCRAMIIPEQFKTQNYYKMIATAVPEIEKTKTATKIKSEKHPYFDTLIMLTEENLPGSFRYRDVITAGGSEEVRRMGELESEVQNNHPALIQFTSGTTGQPKGATISHHSLVNGNITIAESHGYDESYHRICCILPLFHCFGLVKIAFSGMINGNCVVMPASGFDALATLRCIQNEKCTMVFGTPTMYLSMMNHPDFNKFDISTIKRGSVGGASLAPDIMKEIMAKFKCDGFFNGYGLTESNSAAFVSDYRDPIEEKVYSSGRIQEFLEAKIVDGNDRIVAIGTPGEILLRGYKVMLGYWDDEEKTHEAITDDGWLRTGDVGILNENGTVIIVDRNKDMIIRGGENIYPTEIENFLNTHPKILQAHVIGIADKLMGEEVCACIGLKANQTMTEDEVRAFCRGQIAHFKIPRYVQFIDAFPMTVTGKVKKFVLREQLEKIILLAKSSS